MSALICWFCLCSQNLPPKAGYAGEGSEYDDGNECESGLKLYRGRSRRVIDRGGTLGTRPISLAGIQSLMLAKH